MRSITLFLPLNLVHVHLPMPVLSVPEFATRCAALVMLGIPTPPHWLSFLVFPYSWTAARYEVLPNIATSLHVGNVLLGCFADEH